MSEEIKEIRISLNDIDEKDITFVDSIIPMTYEQVCLEGKVFVRHYDIERSIIEFGGEGEGMTSKEIDDLAYERNLTYRDNTYELQLNMGYPPLTFEDIEHREAVLERILNKLSIIAFGEELDIEDKMRLDMKKNHSSEEDYFNTLVDEFQDFVALYKDQYGMSGAKELAKKDMREYLAEMYK